MKTKFSLLLASMLVLSGCAQANISSPSKTDEGDSTGQSSQTETGTPTSTSKPNTPAKFRLEFDESDAIKAYKSEAEGSEEFLQSHVVYKVGDDNKFCLNPKAKIRNMATLTTTDYDENFDLKVEILKEETYTPLTDNEKTVYIDAIDAKKCTIDFADEAVGHTFKLKYIPSAVPESDKQRVTEKELIVEVRDGWNVTDVSELSLISNDTQPISHVDIDDPKPELFRTAKVAWDEYKTAHGIDTTLAPKGIFLHNNLTITTNDFPEDFLMNRYELPEDLDLIKYENTLNDSVTIYQRNLKNNESFEFRGNYFTIDASKIPPVTLERNKRANKSEKVVSHATLFYFKGESEEGQEVNEEAASVVISDTRLIGNAPKSEAEADAGGIIMAKPRAIKYTVENTRSLRWYITYYGEMTRSPILFNKCNASDNFNTFVYAWGCPDLTIKDSTLYGAGGPCVLQDHVGLDADNRDPKNDYISHVNVIDCDMHSYVAGTEGWFDIMKASAIVPSIKDSNLLLQGFLGSSFLWHEKTKEGTVLNDRSYIDLICINKDGSLQGPPKGTAEELLKIKGSITFDNDATFDYGDTDPFFGAAYPGVINGDGLIFKTSAYTTLPNQMKQYGYGMAHPCTRPNPFDATLCLANPLVPKKPEENLGVPFEIYNPERPEGPMFDGDKIALYYKGLMLIFEYSAKEPNPTYIAR